MTLSVSLIGAGEFGSILLHNIAAVYSGFWTFAYLTLLMFRLSIL